jgi:hypothetical protein
MFACRAVLGIDVDLQGIETKEQRRFHDRACHNP